MPQERCEKRDMNGSCHARTKEAKTGQKISHPAHFFPSFIGFCRSLLAERTATLIKDGKKKMDRKMERKREKEKREKETKRNREIEKKEEKRNREKEKKRKREKEKKRKREIEK
jgi:hypothetical protein